MDFRLRCLNVGALKSARLLSCADILIDILRQACPAFTKAVQKDKVTGFILADATAAHHYFCLIQPRAPP